MARKHPVVAWRATIFFYLVLVAVITILDLVNQILSPVNWAIQIILITLGVGILAVIGKKFPDLSAQRGVLLTFSIGVLTIIPAVLLSLNPPGDFWDQYFIIGLSMAAGSFLGFLFVKLYNRSRNGGD
ncbi:MAG TPA: hypothetical protein G4N96_07740 [Chloroflexi bacterium]|nr:MAG: hypothetical protein B6243_14195 [Anaerolineaceae bacterium 4572_5.2]HEY84984.1 hypothetical protein [Chloroflexota bacterium]